MGNPSNNVDLMIEKLAHTCEAKIKKGECTSDKRIVAVLELVVFFDSRGYKTFEKRKEVLLSFCLQVPVTPALIFEKALKVLAQGAHLLEEQNHISLCERLAKAADTKVKGSDRKGRDCLFQD